MKFDISPEGQKQLIMQSELAKMYNYGRQPTNVGNINMDIYYDFLPSFCKMERTSVRNKPGYEIPGKDYPLYSKDGTLIAEKYDRVVIGHYGAFIEIDPSDIKNDNITVKKGEEYRINNDYYKETVKYFWMTTKDESDCKLYFQQKEVSYADYKVDKWYVSPFEVCDEKELEILQESLKEEDIER